MTNLVRLTSRLLVSTSLGLAMMAAGSMLSGVGVEFGDVAYAQDAEKPERKTRKTPAMREKVYSKLAEAQTLAEANDSAGAQKILGQVQAMKDLNSYELAQMWNFFAYIYFTQERYGDALRAYERVLQQPNIPEAMESQTIYSLAQLYFQEDNYRKSIEFIDRWFRTAQNPGPEPYVMKSQAYYQLEDFRAAIPPLETAMRIAREQGKPIKENWLLLQRVYYWELEDYPKVASILEQLVTRFPKKSYWVQLSGMYGEMGQESKQTGALEAVYLMGLFNRGQEYLNLGQLLMQAGYPYRGANVLEEGIEKGLVEKNGRNYRLLAQAWQLSQEDEKAVAPLQQAARLSNDAEMYVRLAQSYLNLDRYDEAVDALQQALNRGGLKRTGDAHVLMGMAYYYDEKLSSARTAFSKARNFDKNKKSANQWVTHITNELNRQAEIEAALARN